MNSTDILKATFRNKNRHYPGHEDKRQVSFPDRVEIGRQQNMIRPALRPSFQIKRSSSVFTIGSCFARNVERFLLAEGVDVPAASFRVPEGEVPGGENRVLNQYNPGSMAQAIQFASEPVHYDGIVETASGAVDLLLATGTRPVSIDRARERREQVHDLYRRSIDQADVVLITLGLVEAWRDKQTGLWLNDVLVGHVRSEPDRYEFHQMNVAQCEEMITQMIASLGEKNVVVTVSPVPLQMTFTDDDCVVANTTSKATLRVAADLVCKKFPNVDYYPSFEMVTLLGATAYGYDNVHVRDYIVHHVVNYMLTSYLEKLSGRH
jgi:hypothetical protein